MQQKIIASIGGEMNVIIVIVCVQSNKPLANVTDFEWNQLCERNSKSWCNFVSVINWVMRKNYP